MPPVVEAGVGLQFQAYDLEAEPDEDEERDESTKDADDDTGIAEAEWNPDPAASESKQLPLVASLQGLKDILAKGFKVLIDPHPVGEDLILLVFVSHDRISKEPRPGRRVHFSTKALSN